MRVFVVTGGDSCGGSESCTLGVAFSRKAAEDFIDRINEYEANIPQPEYPAKRVQTVVSFLGNIATYSDIAPEAWEAYQQARREWHAAHPAGGDGFTEAMQIDEFDTLDELTVTSVVFARLDGGERTVQLEAPIVISREAPTSETPG